MENIGKVEEGYIADLVIFDEKKSFIVEDKTSLYYKDELYGKVITVIKDGAVVEI